MDDNLSSNAAAQQTGLDERLRYSCNKCPYKCQALKSYKCHLQMHGLSRKYKCDYCDWSTDRLNLICQHRRVHAYEQDYNPNPGDIVFLNREFVLDGQKSIEGSAGVTSLDDQDSPFTEEEPKPAHSPKKNARGEKIHYCRLCPFSTESFNTYSYHKKLHCIQANFSCSECSYSINNITSLKEHIKLHKKENELIKESLTEGGVRHKCPKCPYSSPNKNLLVAHTSMHSSGRKYSCTQCDYSSDDKAQLQLHTNVHNGSYSDSDSLEEMELLMKRTPDVIGPQLFFTSSGNTDLDSDTSDNNESDLKCDKCPYSTPSKDELGNHIQQHETPGKTRCMYCSFSCGKEDDLLHHLQVHFPGTNVDKDMLKALRKQSNSHKRNISKTLDDSDVESKGNRFSEVTGEPDSTVNEISKQESSENEKTTSDSGKEGDKTKVYVCQYCEREFDDKATMIQHGKQHLF
jgi:KRAB domain-containing zinc finger protein